MKRFRLHEFVFDCDTYELSRDGQQVALPRLPTRLLLLLLESRGKLVTQRELASELWPHIDPADATPNLHAAIKRIRMALGDTPAAPTYIQTVIGVGYRFIAPVDVEPSDPGSARVGTEAGNTPHGIAPSQAEDLPERVRPSSAILEGAASPPTPASRFTHFDPAVSRQTGRTLRLAWWAAVLLLLGALGWGVQAMRVSRSAAGSLTLAPVMRLTANNTDDAVTAQAISPDGQQLAFADADGLMIQGLHDPAPTPLLLPALQNITALSWFPDGKRIAVSGLSKADETPQVWIVVAEGTSPPALFRDRTSLAVVSLVTGRIAFLTGDGAEVWDAAADGSGLHRLLAADAGKSFSLITWMADRPFLIVQEVRRLTEPELEINPNKLPLPADSTLLVVRPRDGVVTASEAGYQLVDGCALPGDRVFLRIGDLTKPVVVSAMLEPEGSGRLKTTILPSVLPEKNNLSSCSVAPAKRDVALLLRTGEPGVFVGEYNAKDRTLLHAHPITSSKFSSLPHAWSADGQSVLYEQRHDKWYLFQQEIDHHEPQSLRPPQLEGVGARRSPDGRWILFFRTDASGAYKLFHMPSGKEGGSPTELAVPPGDLRCARSGTDCVYRVQDEKSHRAGLYALNPASGALRLLRELPWSDSSFVDWDVSPDGAFVVFCGPTTSTGILRIFDLRHQTERLETFPVKAPFRAVNWNSNGQGWFGVVYTRNGSDMYYLGADHTASLLRQNNYDTWAVPSPNGRFLAFLDMNQDSNVWLTHVGKN